MYSIRIFLCLFSLLLFSGEIIAQNTPIETGAKHEAEELWASIDKLSIRKQILQQTHIPTEDIDLFMMFIAYQYPEDQSQFFKNAEQGVITSSNIDEYVALLTQKYISTYELFLSNKIQFALKQRSVNNLPQAINGPCTNVDFEDGTMNGWETFTGRACQQTIPCDLVNGYVSTRHEIMTTAMVDPYIPTLPVVAPGGSASLRLENYVNGGNATMVQQTFLVTPTNNIFTYRYAAVLEDPGDHGDAERPYFKVRMYDKNGKEIPCATYTAIAKPPIQNFTRVKVPNPNFDPTKTDGGGNNSILDLYYRDWTTVTIPLLGLEGQNVTIQFIASDCSRGGHLGYAYVDAKCSFLQAQIPPTICGSEDVVTLYGPDDFAAYLWSGPGIIGSKTTQNITASKSGKYTLKLTPVADKPCPITISTIIPERCLPPAISANLCETTKGSLITKGINLTQYNIPITAYTALGSVLEWHSGKPATAANRVTNPSLVDISNGSKFYAIIKYSTAGSDTAEIAFKVNSSPVMQFSTINPLCEGGLNTDITSYVSPLGGTFKGNSITSAGVFSPAVSGTYPITYVAMNTFGCKDSIKSSIIVNKPPTIVAGSDQKLCATPAAVNLKATATNQISIAWTGGAGSFSSQALTTSYAPTASEIASGSVLLQATVTGKTPCASKTDDVLIEFIAPPLVNAGIDQEVCIDKALSISLNGSGSDGQSYTWSGGNGNFTLPNSFNSKYEPSEDELISGTITLTINATSNAPCLSISDDVLIHIHELPIADAGLDKVVCVGTTVQFTSPIILDNSYTWASESGIVLSNTNTISVNADKDTVVVLTLTNQFGCIDKDTAAIEAYIPPIFNMVGPYCLKDEINLMSNPTIFQTVNESPIWKKDGIEITGANTFDLLVKTYGEYMIQFTHGECTVSAKADVFNSPVIETPDLFTVCEQQEVIVTTTSIPNANYVWEIKGVVLLGNTNTNTIISVPGNNKYKIHVTDEHNCSTIDSFFIVGIPNPIVSLSDMSICGNDQFKIDATPSNSASFTEYTLVYEWKFNDVLQSNNANYYTTSQAGKYDVKVSVGTCIGESNMDITLKPIPVIDLPSVYKFCPDTDGEIMLDAGPANTYKWSPGGETTQTIKVKSQGYYTLTVTNDADCSNSDKTFVRELCPPRLFVADAFSPNYDGTNDMFNVYGIHIGTFKLLIFNRWGEVIFESKDKDYFWNGIYKDDIMPIGVYPWVITYEGDSPEFHGPYKLEGSVTIVK